MSGDEIAKDMEFQSKPVAGKTCCFQNVLTFPYDRGNDSTGIGLFLISKPDIGFLSGNLIKNPLQPGNRFFGSSLVSDDYLFGFFPETLS